MKEQFLNYSQSLVLKELGFDEPCFSYYVDGELRGVNLGLEELGGKKPYYQRFGFHTILNSDIDNSNKIVVCAPLIQQAFKFFRDKYKLCSWVYQTDDNKFFYTILDAGRFVITHEQSLKDYENAEQECLNKLIDVVRTRVSFFNEPKPQ